MYFTINLMNNSFRNLRSNFHLTKFLLVYTCQNVLFTMTNVCSGRTFLLFQGKNRRFFRLFFHFSPLFFCRFLLVQFDANSLMLCMIMQSHGLQPFCLPSLPPDTPAHCRLHKSLPAACVPVPSGSVFPVRRWKMW